MKRDWELIREILLAIEAKPDDSWLGAEQIEGYSIEEISYHYKILHQAGLIEADFKGGLWWAKELTWQGHELLDSLREKALWNKIKEEIKEKGMSLSFEAIRVIASELIKRFL